MVIDNFEMKFGTQLYIIYLKKNNNNNKLELLLERIIISFRSKTSSFQTSILSL